VNDPLRQIQRTPYSTSTALAGENGSVPRLRRACLGGLSAACLCVACLCRARQTGTQTGRSATLEAQAGDPVVSLVACAFDPACGGTQGKPLGPRFPWVCHPRL
jgi:hypothetical protein